MKLKDKDGGLIYSFETALDQYCENRICTSCDVDKAAGGHKCRSWAKKHELLAAALMGYDLVWEKHGDCVPEKNRTEDQNAKADDGKPRPSLVPVSLIEAVTQIREYGCQKYKDPDNWKKVDPERYKNALYRHWLAYLSGEKNDKESGRPHLWHMACNIAFLIEMEKNNESD